MSAQRSARSTSAHAAACRCRRSRGREPGIDGDASMAILRGLSARACRPREPDGHGRVLARPDWIGHRVAPRLEPLRLVAEALLPSARGAPPSRYSSAAGSGEENILTATRARARHRGQCSTVSQRAFGLMLRPQRGQFRNGAARRLAARSSVLVINATLSTARGTRHASPTSSVSVRTTRVRGCAVGLDPSMKHRSSRGRGSQTSRPGRLSPAACLRDRRRPGSDRPCRPDKALPQLQRRVEPVCLAGRVAGHARPGASRPPRNPSRCARSSSALRTPGRCTPYPSRCGCDRSAATSASARTAPSYEHSCASARGRRSASCSASRSLRVRRLCLELSGPALRVGGGGRVIL
jgi:hypothetical protein